MKPSLLVCRGVHYQLRSLSLNKELTDQLQLLVVQQGHQQEFADMWPTVTSFDDRPDQAHIEHVETYYRALIRGWNVKYVLLLPKLMWYTELVAKVCAEEGAECFWTEHFFGGRFCIDRVGSQFTRDNEIRKHADRATYSGAPLLPTQTRANGHQPLDIPRETLYARYGLDESTVCVLGQVPHDHSLLEYSDLGYIAWLKALATQNPNTKFAFKHHPLWPTPEVVGLPNVTIINESINSILSAFDMIAAFSSTTIFESVSAGKKVVSGGYHYLSGSKLCIEEPSDLSNIVERLQAHTIDVRHLERWQSFLCNRYSVDLTGAQLLERLTTTSEEYFR